MKQLPDFNSFLIKKFPDSEELRQKNGEGIKYHYTSAEAFLSIIKNKKIRFSDIRYMNDKSEGAFFVKCLIEFIEEHSEQYPNVLLALRKILDSAEYDKIKRQGTSPVRFNEFKNLKYQTTRCFLFCASNKPDLLNMWNYYLHNNAYEGYNIGFYVLKLLKSFDTNSKRCADPYIIYYGNVLYGKKEQEIEIEKLLRRIERQICNDVNCFEGGIDKFEWAAIQLRMYISAQGYFFKDSFFSGEQEYRVLISISNERLKNKDKKEQWISNMKDIEEDFFVRHGIVVPCFSITIPDDAVSCVCLPPTIEKEIAKEGVSELIDSAKFKKVQIHQSKMPVRF